VAAIVPHKPARELPSLAYLDRYRNEGTRTYSPHAAHTEADPQYRPTSQTQEFGLPVLEMPANRMNIYTANPSPDLVERYLPKGRALFCIHPQVVQMIPDDPYLLRTFAVGEARADVPVSPSSSTRTLLVHGGDPQHALKVHFPFRVSRYGRKMRDEVVEQAIAVSGELEGGLGRMAEDFAFQREVMGVTHHDLHPDSERGENWGYLVRELDPYPHVEGKWNLVPGFALYGRDFFDANVAPLLFDLMGTSARPEFVLEKIMLPIIRHWVEAFLEFGFILEPHGQNVLLEAGTDGEVRRIVHRDLSVCIHMGRRRDTGIGEGILNRYNRTDSGDFASIAYDRFMGGHFFDRIVGLLREDDRTLRRKAFLEPCREEFERVFPEHQQYMPRTVRYFSEQRDRFGKPLFVDTGVAPEWRP
jgi:hypothetical protein